MRNPSSAAISMRSAVSQSTRAISLFSNRESSIQLYKVGGVPNGRYGAPPAHGGIPGKCLLYCAVTVMVAGALAMPPVITTTGWVPSGAVVGTSRLIWVTPTRAVGIPSNRTGAGTPPMETVVSCTGAGNCVTGVPAAGAAPVAMAGDTAPVPVRYTVRTPPRATVATGTIAPLASVNKPGAAEATVNVVVAVRPLLVTVRMTGLLTGVSRSEERRVGKEWR